MKRIMALLLAALMLCALAACGKTETSSFSVSASGEKLITVAAQNAKTDSVGVTTITLGENEELFVDAAFADSGELVVRFAPGEYGAETFPMETSSMTITGEDKSAVGNLEAGVYTVAVSPGRDGLTGTAQISAHPMEQAPVSAADYSGVTAMEPAEVEAFCADAKQAYLDGDWAKLADLICYPVMVNGSAIDDKDAFLAFMADRHVADTDRQEMEEETCADLFFNGQGICLGAGEIWIRDVNYLTDADPLLQIIALNGIE